MKNFNYSVIITTEDNRFTYETNDVREAIRAVFECGEDDAHICLCNGYTGEVLYHNGEEPWCTDEMALMMLGFVVEQAGAEEDEDDEPICPYCGGPVNANGVCQHCGVENDTLTAENVVLALIQSMGGLPS